MYALKPSVADIRTTPEISAAERVDSESPCIAAWIHSATDTARWPSSVSSQPPTVRERSGPPIAFSSAAILRETVVWFRPTLAPPS